MDARQFVKRNASTILTGLGSIGVIATSVMAVKATPKALSLINEAKEDKGEELTKLETVKVAWKPYIPAVLIGTATLTCIIGSNVLNKKKQASIISAYALLDQSYKEYQNKVKDIYGEEAHQEIVNTIALEKAEDVYIHSECLCNSCDLSVEEHSSKLRLFYDEYSNRFFESTIEQVMAAEYHLNRNYILRGFTVLNELYEFLGLEPTDYGSVMGWAPLDDGMYWIDFNHRKSVLKDGTEFYILEMPFAPTLDYEEY